MEHHTLTHKIACLSVLAGLVATSTLMTMDNMHWYRARLWNNEPRSPKVPYQSFDMIFGGGATTHGFDNTGDKTPIFGIYGPENLHKLGINVPSVSNPDERLKANFGTQFMLYEVQLEGTWNFCHGVFARMHLPIRIMRAYNIQPLSTASYNPETTEWKSVNSQLEALYATHNLQAHQVKETGPGDLSLLLGYSHTFYQSCSRLDYVDLCLQTGILTPTGTKRDLKNPFSIPLGYNGHVGLPIIGDLATGLWDWFTIGVHAEGLILFKRGELLRPVSYDNQPFLRLTEPLERKVKPGNLWNVSWYVKADHIAYGLSLLFGFSHDQQGASRIEWHADDAAQKLHDPTLEGWNMNVLHSLIEYDWSTEENHHGPRMQFVYDYIINGRNILDTSMINGAFGLDFEWCF